MNKAEIYMKTNSKADKELVKIIITVVMTVIFCIFVWIFLNSQTSQLSKGYINGIAKDNEYIVTAIASNIASSATNEDQAVEMIQSAPVSGARYWFLYSSESLVFERNMDTTADLGGMTYKELAEYYIRNGGSGGNEYFDLINAGEDFTAVVLKDRPLGSELISVTFIEVAGQKYCVGTSVLPSYMFSAGKIGERIFYLRIMTLIMCFVTIALTAYLSSANRKKALYIRILQNDLAEKNILVQEQGERLFESDSDDSDKSDDNLTGLYNRKFFEAIVAKLATRNVENIGIVYLRINNLTALNYESGFASTNRLIVETAKLIKLNATDKDICARISRNEFAMLKFETTYKLTVHTAQKLYTELKEKHPSAIFSEGSSYKRKDVTIEVAIEAAWTALNKTEERD